MTSQELIDNGWVGKTCKVGTLYFNHAKNMFIRLDGEEATVYSISDDEHHIGKAKTIDDIEQLDRELFENEIALLETKLAILKMAYKQTYGKSYEEAKYGLINEPLS